MRRTDNEEEGSFLTAESSWALDRHEYLYNAITPPLPPSSSSRQLIHLSQLPHRRPPSSSTKRHDGRLTTGGAIAHKGATGGGAAPSRVPPPTQPDVDLPLLPSSILTEAAKVQRWAQNGVVPQHQQQSDWERRTRRGGAGRAPRVVSSPAAASTFATSSSDVADGSMGRSTTTSAAQALLRRAVHDVQSSSPQTKEGTEGRVRCGGNERGEDAAEEDDAAVEPPRNSALFLIPGDSSPPQQQPSPVVEIAAVHEREASYSTEKGTPTQSAALYAEAVRQHAAIKPNLHRLGALQDALAQLRQRRQRTLEKAAEPLTGLSSQALCHRAAGLLLEEHEERLRDAKQNVNSNNKSGGGGASRESSCQNRSGELLDRPIADAALAVAREFCRLSSLLLRAGHWMGAEDCLSRARAMMVLPERDTTVDCLNQIEFCRSMGDLSDDALQMLLEKCSATATATSGGGGGGDLPWNSESSESVALPGGGGGGAADGGAPTSSPSTANFVVSVQGPSFESTVRSTSGGGPLQGVAAANAAPPSQFIAVTTTSTSSPRGGSEVLVGASSSLTEFAGGESRTSHASLNRKGDPREETNGARWGEPQPPAPPHVVWALAYLGRDRAVAEQRLSYFTEHDPYSLGLVLTQERIQRQTTAPAAAARSGASSSSSSSAVTLQSRYEGTVFQILTAQGALEAFRADHRSTTPHSALERFLAPLDTVAMSNDAQGGSRINTTITASSLKPLMTLPLSALERLWDGQRMGFGAEGSGGGGSGGGGGSPVSPVIVAAPPIRPPTAPSPTHRQAQALPPKAPPSLLPPPPSPPQQQQQQQQQASCAIVLPSGSTPPVTTATTTATAAATGSARRPPPPTFGVGLQLDPSMVNRLAVEPTVSDLSHVLSSPSIAFLAASRSRDGYSGEYVQLKVPDGQQQVELSPSVVLSLTAHSQKLSFSSTLGGGGGVEDEQKLKQWLAEEERGARMASVAIPSVMLFPSPPPASRRRAASPATKTTTRELTKKSNKPNSNHYQVAAVKETDDRDHNSADSELEGDGPCARRGRRIVTKEEEEKERQAAAARQRRQQLLNNEENSKKKRTPQPPSSSSGTLNRTAAGGRTSSQRNFLHSSSRHASRSTLQQAKHDENERQQHQQKEQQQEVLTEAMQHLVRSTSAARSATLPFGASATNITPSASLMMPDVELVDEHEGSLGEDPPNHRHHHLPHRQPHHHHHPSAVGFVEASEEVGDSSSATATTTERSPASPASVGLAAHGSHAQRRSTSPAPLSPSPQPAVGLERAHSLTHHRRRGGGDRTDARTESFTRATGAASPPPLSRPSSFAGRQHHHHHHSHPSRHQDGGATPCGRGGGGSDGAGSTTVSISPTPSFSGFSGTGGGGGFGGMASPNSKKKTQYTVQLQGNFPVFDGEFATVEAPGATQRLAKKPKRRAGLQTRRTSVLTKPKLHPKERAKVEKAAATKILKWYRACRWWAAAREALATQRWVKYGCVSLLSRVTEGYAVRWLLATREYRPRRAAMRIQRAWRCFAARRLMRRKQEVLLASRERRERHEEILERRILKKTLSIYASKQVRQRQANVQLAIEQRIADEAADQQGLVDVEEATLEALWHRFAALDQRMTFDRTQSTIRSRYEENERLAHEAAMEAARRTQDLETKRRAQIQIAKVVRRWLCRAELTRRRAERELDELVGALVKTGHGPGELQASLLSGRMAEEGHSAPTLLSALTTTTRNKEASRRGEGRRDGCPL